MNTKAEQTARDAGFLTHEELLSQAVTSNVERDHLCGMDIVTTPIMPEGYAAIRSDTGAMILAPGGKSWWVPFVGK